MTTAQPIGVRVAGVGSAVPPGVLTNADLERMVDTSDEWIVKRTGIRQRHVVDPKTEGTFTLSCKAVRNALDDAQIQAKELDLLILATVTAEMTCPSVACRVLAEIGAAPTPGFDLVAACSGFVYSINLADSLIRSGRHGTVAVIGSDTMSTVMDYRHREVPILFGDAAGAAILTADPDPNRGCLYQKMNADGRDWETLYLPRRQQDVPESDEANPIAMGNLRMNGREVYRFAVGKLRDMIAEALRETNLSMCDVKRIFCHQSNARIMDAASERLGIPDGKLYQNIEHYGNSSAGSVGLCFDQLWKAREVGPGDTVMFVAIGGGMTWSSSVWQL